jgi:hypothetical protein
MDNLKQEDDFSKCRVRLLGKSLPCPFNTFDSYFSPTGFNESQLQEVYAAETQLGQLDNGEFQHSL